MQLVPRPIHRATGHTGGVAFTRSQNATLDPGSQGKKDDQ
jgi:hypothetical protein